MKFFSVLFTIIISLSIASCTSLQKKSDSLPRQSGALLLAQLQYQKVENSDDVEALIPSFLSNESISNASEHTENLSLISDLFWNIVQENNPRHGLEKSISKGEHDKLQLIKWYLTYFPLERASLLNDSSLVDDESRLLVLILLGEDPTSLFEATALGETELIITPLIESTSVTLTNQSSDVLTAIKYKKKDEQEWKDGNPLIYEPLTGQLTGSIVYLEPDTNYELRIETMGNSTNGVDYETTFRTRPNSPPIDPDNVHRLEDIYSGGILDIEALGIQGREGAWAKIVGSPGSFINAPISASHAINIGSNSYIYFENITVRGGTHGIFSYRAHHLWINGCDVANWGRIPAEYRNGRAYASADATSPMNYDSGMYFKESGVIVVENCYVHNPNYSANSWEHGHPKGPNAFWANANHPNLEYKGQIVIRDNIFSGSDTVRFNDVIEGRSNGSINGGFVRNSAVYNNILAFANDDIIEIDGGQSNVLIYDNDISHGYAGVSAIPAVIGPSYIFNNTIHDLGDERGKMWTAIKLGGLHAKPIGQVNVFNNSIMVYRNGISASNYQGDASFWVNARNNVIVTDLSANMVGYNVYDPSQYVESTYKDNAFQNLTRGTAKLEMLSYDDVDSLSNLSLEQAIELYSSTSTYSILFDTYVPNFTRLNSDGEVIYRTPTTVNSEQRTSALKAPSFVPAKESPYLDIRNFKIWSYTKDQDVDGLYEISTDGTAITLKENTWKRIIGKPFLVSADTTLEFEYKVNGSPEIVGLGFDTNNSFWAGHLLNLFGRQKVGQPIENTKAKNEFNTVSLKLSDYIKPGKYETLFIVLDNDEKLDDVEVTFKNIILTD